MTDIKTRHNSTNFMRQRIYDILWLTLAGTTIVFGYYIYKSWTTEYDENVNALAIAVLISIFTTIVLVYLIFKDSIKNKLKTCIKYFTIFCGTPITLLFFWTYIGIFQMNFIYTSYSTRPNKPYQAEKYRNYFKAKNILINENLSVKPDTIVGIVLRNGTVDQIFRLKMGDTINLGHTEIEKLTKEQIIELTTY